MAEPSQNRVEFSGIHPLKRLTLIVLGFIFGVSLVCAVTMQFFWGRVIFFYPGSQITVTSLENYIILWLGPFEGGGWDLLYDYLPNAEFEPSNGLTFPENTLGFPGLYIEGPYDDGFAVYIHHAWLISITAALYLFVRWRIRRSARIKNQPS